MSREGSEGDFDIVSINVSRKTGTRKRPVESARFVEERGMEGDAHAGLIENRQVSLLAVEEIEEANLKLAEKLREKARETGAARADVATAGAARVDVATAGEDAPLARGTKPHLHQSSRIRAGARLRSLRLDSGLRALHRPHGGSCG